MASTKLWIGVFTLDLIAFALAVAAELKRSTAMIKHDSELMFNYCNYDSNIATHLGVDAAMLLMASQVLVTEASQCFFFKKALSPKIQGLGRKYYITCWVTFFIAEVCLLVGSMMNANHTTYRWSIFRENLSAQDECKTLRKGVFGAGAAFILLNGIMSQLYIVLYSKDQDCFQTESEDTNEKLGDYTPLAK